MPEPASAPDTSRSTGPDPYAVLGVRPDADEREIARAYRRSARRTHPDLGGSAADFAAVQAAWETLSGPAGSAEDEDVWDLADWGAAADEPDDDAGSPVDGGATAWPPAHPGAARTPFTAGAVRLPEPVLGTPRRARARTSGPLDRALLGTALTGAAVVAGTVAVAGPGISGIACATAVTWVVAWSVGIPVGRRFGAHGLIPWVAVWALLSSAVLSTAREAGDLSPPALVLLAGVGLAGAALTWWLIRRAGRRAQPSTRLREAERAGRVIERHRIAEEWNLVREALSTPGATVERLLDAEPARGPRCWTSLDARTGQSRTRCLDLERLDLEVGEGTWLVLDAQGRVLATAPPRAKDAWVESVRRGARR